MVTRALEKYIRISPKKLKPIAELVRKKSAEDAVNMLFTINKKGAAMLKKIIESAVSNAKKIPDKNFTETELFISKIVVNQGPTLKRYRAMSMGRAGVIRKRTSHVLVELDTVKTDTPKPVVGPVKKEAEKLKRKVLSRK
ncbi:MAG: 50S ribosomal protein L22 [Candidatus Omnitrophica bacterium]|nr:50S ribosomal protein L22 [Candidatus Omnitrophota bacterium]